MKIIYITIVILLHINSVYCKRYDNFVLYNAVPTTMDQLHFLQNIQIQKYLQVIFWKPPLKLNMDVQLLVDPNESELFLERAMHFGLRVETLIQNIQEAFNNQTVKSYAHLVIDNFYWDFYHDLEDIYRWLSDIAERNEDVELEVIGKSTEGRDIIALSMKRPRTGPKVIVEGGIHGNEWLPVSFVMYLIHKLVNAESSGDRKLIEVARRYHWYLIPIANPDGYNYSMAEDRLWRKNRRAVEGSFGVDLDRNFNYSFGGFGASNDSSSEFYCGPSPASELETIALVDFVTRNSKNLKYYFSFHAYGQKIIIPYPHTLQHLENYPEMYNYGRQALGILKKDHGARYGLGTYYDTLGQKISGNSAGWVKSTFGTQYVFTFLLRDNGSYGYALPNNMIGPSCKEALTALVHIMTAKPMRFRSRYLLHHQLSGGRVKSSSVHLVFVLVMMIKVLV